MVPMLASGARGKLVINGKPVAFITNVNVSRNDIVRVPHCFGSYHGKSTEPLSYSVAVSIGTVIPINDQDGKAVNSSAAATGVAPLLQSMATSEDVSVELIDKPTGATLKAVKNCRFTGEQMGLSAQQLGNRNWSLVGLYSTDDGAPDQLGFGN
jgi:hypothetical protein